MLQRPTIASAIVSLGWKSEVINGVVNSSKQAIRMPTANSRKAMEDNNLLEKSKHTPTHPNIN